MHRHLLVLAMILAPAAHAAGSVPAQYQGKWVPAKANCESAAAAIVAADRLTIVNGRDRETLGGVQMAGPGWFPRDYRGIMAVMLTEFSGHQPATMTFNAGERRGAAVLEFSPAIRTPHNAEARAYNARITKLALAKRFPLHNVPLKRCGGK